MCAWEVRKQKWYVNDSCPNQLQSQSLPGGSGGKGMVNYLHCVWHRVTVGAHKMYVGACTCKCTCKCDNVHSCMDTCMCSSTHSCGCAWLMTDDWWLFEN